MTDLLDIKSAKGKFFITVLFVLLVIGLFIAAYIIPKRNSIKKLEADLTLVEDNLRKASQKVKELEVLKKQWPVVKEERKALASLIPENSKETELVEFLHYLAAYYSVDIEQVDVSEPKDIPLITIPDDKKTDQEKALDKKLVMSIKKLDTSIRIGGKFNDILAFLDGIKRSNRYLEVYKVELPEENTTNEIIDGRPMVISGNFYYYSRDLSEAKSKSGEFEQMIESQGLGDKYLEKDSGKSSQPSTGTTPKKKISPEEDIDKWIAESSDETKSDSSETDDNSAESSSTETTQKNNSSSDTKSDENTGTIEGSGTRTTSAIWEGAKVCKLVSCFEFNDGSFVDRILIRVLAETALGVNA